jgi:hypothetical protein
MNFTSVTKSVVKIQKSIIYLLSMIFILFFHSWKVGCDSFRQMNPFFLLFH